MSRILTHLTFNGNCRQAMTFYRHCLGGKLYFQTVGDAPESKKIPKEMGQLILLARLEWGNMALLGSDLVGEKGLSKGNNVSIWVETSSEKETRNLYKKLIKNGQSEFPLQKTYWGNLFGGLVDQFGQHWLFYSKEAVNSLPDENPVIHRKLP